MHPDGFQMVLQVAAPTGYFEWLRDQNVCVPEIEYMRGAAVSKVLLQECDADTLGLLMDVSASSLQKIIQTRFAKRSAFVITHLGMTWIWL